MYSLEQGNAEYTSDIKKVAENFRKQLVNRENEITLYYYSDEPITGEHFNNLTSQLFDLAVQHTGKGNEGDYILWHCQGWHVGANCSSNPNGGFDMNITYTVSYLSDAAQEEKVAQIEKEVWGIYNNIWYYFSASGAMQSGWLNLGNTWYYLRGDGSMATGWLNLGNTWYYLRGDGSMAIGWLNLGNTWYYLRGDGSMTTGWLNLGNTWYYLRADGSMASNTWIGNSYVDGSGAWTSSR